MTPYFRRSMSPMERHGCRGRGEILSPKTHGHVLLRESRFQERVLGDQWDTYPRLEALCQSISEKRAFLGCATQWPWCHLSPKKWCRRATKFTVRDNFSILRPDNVGQIRLLATFRKIVSSPLSRLVSCHDIPLKRPSSLTVQTAPAGSTCMPWNDICTDLLPPQAPLPIATRALTEVGMSPEAGITSRQPPRTT